MADGAVIIEVRRSGFVESVHHASIVILDPDGRIERVWGDAEQVVLPRSALKPLQATAMVRAGLRNRGAQLAVGCASHDGAESQVAVVASILADAQVLASALRCPPALPEGVEAREQFLRAGREPDSIHHECSGKHASMLATCAGAGWPTESYLDMAHPLQDAIHETVADLAAERIVASAVDGCGAPVHAISLTGLATAYSKLAAADAGDADSAAAEAMRAYPELVAGPYRDVTAAMRAIPGLIVKDGAEGVYALGMPDGRAAAFKIEDGALRAAPPLMCAILRYWQIFDADLARFAEPVVLGRGAPVGSIHLRAGDLIGSASDS